MAEKPDPLPDPTTLDPLAARDKEARQRKQQKAADQVHRKKPAREFVQAWEEMDGAASDAWHARVTFDPVPYRARLATALVELCRRNAGHRLKDGCKLEEAIANLSVVGMLDQFGCDQDPETRQTAFEHATKILRAGLSGAEAAQIEDRLAEYLSSPARRLCVYWLTILVHGLVLEDLHLPRRSEVQAAEVNLPPADRRGEESARLTELEYAILQELAKQHPQLVQITDLA